MNGVNASDPSVADHNFSRRLFLYRLLSVACILVALIICCLEQIRRNDGDPTVFVHAARLLMQGQDIYAIYNQHGSLYLYPPLFAFLNIPLTLLPAAALIVVWSLGSVAAPR